MAFGSVAQAHAMPFAYKIAFLEAFAQFPTYTFLWKYDDNHEDEELFSKYTNVHIRSWIPQVNLLSNLDNILPISLIYFQITAK